jgi:amino acid adenylation domain-containing protein/non-ribosomal peptide synthase protein (TIGR01720 family)
VPGELHVGGDVVSSGYHGCPERTARRFCPDPFAERPGARLYRTGDRARWSDRGDLEMMGKVSESRAGAAVSTLVLQSLLLEHPSVGDAAAVVRNGRGRTARLSAYLVPAPGESLSALELRRFLKEKLASSSEPSELFEVERIPIDDHGRLDRTALFAAPARILVSSAPDSARRLTGEEMDELCRRSNLTKHQFLMWTGQKLHPEAPIYNCTFLFTIEGAVAREPLERAFQRLVAASDALRTVIEEVDGLPRQRVLVQPSPYLEYRDFSSEKRPESAVRLWAEARCRIPLDMSRPLTECALVKLSPSRFALYLNQHHSITDGWSIALIFSHLADLYRAEVSGEAREARLPSFSDWVQEERAHRDGADYLEDRAYWLQRIPALGEPIPWYEDSDPLRRSTVVARQSVELGQERSRRLRELASSGFPARERLHRSLFVVFAGLLLTLMYRVSGKRRLSLGTPLGCRPSGPARETIGLFMRVYPLLVTFSEGETYRTAMEKVLDELLTVERHRQYTVGNPPQRPLFDVLINYHNAVFPGFHGNKVKSEWIHPGHEVLSMALQIHDYDGSGSFTLDFDLVADTFDAPRRMRTARQFLTILDEFLEDPERRIDGVGLLGREEEHLLLHELTASHRPYDARATFVLRFLEQVAKTPERTAAACQGSYVSYAELSARSDRLARALKLRGVASGVVVALLAERGLEFLTAMLGIWRSGGAYLPLDPLDPEERLRQLVHQSGVGVVVVTESLMRVAAGFEIPSKTVGALVEEGLSATEADLGPVSPRDLSYVIFTSGSTGVPKGAMVEHAGMLNHLNAKVADLGLDAADVVCQTAPQCFDISVWQFLSPLVVGGRVEVFPDEITHDPVLMLDAVERHAATVLETVPTMLRAVLEEIERGARGSAALDALRWLMVTGEALPPELCRRWLAAHPSIPMMNAYGPTECSDDVTHHVIRQAPAMGEARAFIGTAVANTRLYVLDRSLHLVPSEMAGELFVGGIGVGRGYLFEPGKTAERFLPDPFSEQAGLRLYRTGDLARFSRSGELDFLGRVDHQVKVRGYRIELGEIEAALSEHPAVRAAVAVAEERETGGKGLVAYFVASEAAPAVESAVLRAHLKGRLPDYMVPAVFVPLDVLPLTPSGKVDRKALPRPKQPEVGSAETYVPATSAVEKTLSRIWTEVLGVSRVGVHENFFELGGESILAIQVVARANRAGLRLTARHMFQYQTIAELAKVAESARPIEAEQGIVEGAVPLTPIQRRFFVERHTDLHHFNQAVFLQVRRPDASILERASAALAEHHDALRLRFTRSSSSIRQWIAPPGGSSAFTEIDLSRVPADGLEEALEREAARAQESLDLERGPLFRMILFRTRDDSARLLILAHHLTLDAVSWRILLEDLLSVYQQLRLGEVARLPAKTSSYRAWAERLERHAGSSELEQELAYWRRVVSGGAASLPRDRKGQNSVGSTRKVSVALEPEETEALVREVPAAYRTRIDEVLLAALLTSLAEWTGQSSVLLELEGHGREDLFDDLDVSRTVGWFTSVYPLRLELPGTGRPQELLTHVKEELRRIPGHGIGYGLLKYMRAEDPLAAGPAFRPEVLFNYLGRYEQAAPADGAEFADRADARTALPEGAGVSFAPESMGRLESGRAERTHLLDVSGAIGGGRLLVEWRYSENVHDRRTIERIAARFVEALKDLIRHCQSADAGAYTPSDFQGFEWNEDDLDQITDAIGRTIENE